MHDAKKGLEKLIEELSAVPDAVKKVQELERLQQLEVALEVLNGLYWSYELIPVITKLLETTMDNQNDEEKILLVNTLQNLFK